jgi:hypothetical protein
VGVQIARARLVLSSDDWPNASNTGVPPGTSLTPDSDVIQTTTNGEVIEALHVTNGVIEVRHDNVTIRNCLFENDPGEGWFSGVAIVGTHTGWVIEDCEMATGSCSDAAFGTIRRCNIYNTENGFHVTTDMTLEDNYIHDLFGVGAEPHVDGLQCSQGASNVVVRHNNFDLLTPEAVDDNPDQGPSAGIQWNSGGDVGTDWLVENNRVVLYSTGPAPGAITIRLPEIDASSDNHVCINNHLGAGAFGYLSPIPPDTITTWSGNVDYLTGDPVP